MTLGVGTTNELGVTAADVVLADPDVSMATATLAVEVPEGVPGAAASLVQPARPTNTTVTRATANLLPIGRTPLAAVSNPSTIAATCGDEKQRSRNVDN
jgi:hypothetical protein